MAKVTQHKRSELSIWGRHIFLAVAIIAVAAVVVILQERRSQLPIAVGEDGKPKSAAQGLSDFYEDYRGGGGKPTGEKLGDYVVAVNEADTPLSERLKSRENPAQATSSGWVGEHKFRAFKAGATLREAISYYAQKEGMQVAWELDQDFIIKSQFQINDSLVGALRTLSSAIDSNFDGEVLAYFCPNHRTLVVTAKDNAYLRANCVLSQDG